MDCIRSEINFETVIAHSGSFLTRQQKASIVATSSSELLRFVALSGMERKRTKVVDLGVVQGNRNCGLNIIPTSKYCSERMCRKMLSTDNSALLFDTRSDFLSTISFINTEWRLHKRLEFKAKYLNLPMRATSFSLTLGSMVVLAIDINDFKHFEHA